VAEKGINRAHPNVRADDSDAFVQLSEHRDGWSIDVSVNRRPAVLHSLHASAEEALQVAIHLAVTQRAGLLILTRSNEPVFVPPAEVDGYVWSPRN
jgi:hypothetical protein